mmetsp:Transcript_39133/g.80151  ORF Transcript_39133/g.80151 Transcript_39133/m.80151 type:complete len:109 (-) Transcript_39133:81-407(-)
MGKCRERPVALRWMHGLCDAMTNDFSDAYGAWPTAFFIFERRALYQPFHAQGSAARSGNSAEGAEAVLVFRSRPSADAHIDVMEALQALWSLSEASDNGPSGILNRGE